MSGAYKGGKGTERANKLLYIQPRAEDVFHLLVDRKSREVGGLCGLIVHAADVLERVARTAGPRRLIR